MNVLRTARKNGVGETSSKYGYPGGDDQFIADINAHVERDNFLWSKFISFMQSHNVTPSELRKMFTRYYEEFLS